MYSRSNGKGLNGDSICLCLLSRSMEAFKREVQRIPNGKAFERATDLPTLDHKTTKPKFPQGNISKLDIQK